MTLKQKDYENLQNTIGPFAAAAKRQMDNVFTRYQLVDSYLEKESDRTSETLQGEIANRMGNKKIANCEIPVVMIKQQTALAYLAGTFLSGFPIFAAVTKKRDLESGAAMLNTLTARDQQRLGWVGELLNCFNDVLKFNICGSEVSWVAKHGSTATTSIVRGASKTGAVTPVVYEGMQIKRLDPYNLIYDTMVTPSKVHTDGNYVGYVEILDHIGLKRWFADLNQVYTYKKNIDKYMKGDLSVAEGYTRLYKVPQIHKYNTSTIDPTDFSGFFGTAGSSNKSLFGCGFEKLVIYRRLIPRDFGIEMENSGSVHIFKLIYINGHMAYAEPLALGHEYLPIIIGQYSLGSVDKKSFSEYLVDNQDLATSFMTATLSSMRKAVGDRIFYDATRIRKSDIDSTNPTSRIPVSANMFQNGLEGAVKVVPYTDNISGNMQNMMNVVMGLADVTTGINQSTQGAFTPGNKTVAEYQDIQSNSQARLKLGATHLAVSFIQPIKEILKLGYLVHAAAETVEDQQTNTQITIDPAKLRKDAPDYRMADGLIPTTKIANTEVTMSALSVIQNHPLLSIQYDVGAMIVSVLHQQGFENLAQYERSPQEQQQYMEITRGMQPNATDSAPEQQ